MIDYNDPRYLRRKARWNLKDAVRHGKITRGNCEMRGLECDGPIEGHHDDYSKPLEVRWFCRHHHRILDGKKFARHGESNGAIAKARRAGGW